MLRKLGLILIGAVLAVLALQIRAPAQTAANLQSDIFQLQRQVSQLQAQVAQLGARGTVRSAPLPAPQGSSRRSAELSDSQIIDRLATLAIEAKDRLTSLEQRVTRLEQRSR